jgi:hydroxyacylglutathione hydrolase
MESLLIETVPYFSDNYAYLIHHGSTGKTALVDCGEAEPVLKQLARNNWSLDSILITHHHYDHISGVSRLNDEFPHVTLYSSSGRGRGGSSLVEVNDGDMIHLGSLKIEAVRTPAHTRDITCFYLPGHLFVSDALFSAGCGRLFEGTAADLELAMDRFASFPPETFIYFGHEYTIANLRFALTVEPDNQDIQDYMSRCQEKLKVGKFTTPTTVAQELKVNPFLRIDQEDVIRFVDPGGHYNRRKRIGLLRKVKDNF